MSHDSAQDYRRYHSIIKRLLLTVGLWPNSDPNIFYQLLPFPYLFVNISVVLGTAVYIQMHLTNVASITKGLSIMTSFGTVILKMTCIMINRDNVNELHDILDLHFNKMLNDQQISSTILKDFRTFRRLSWSFSFFVTIVILLTAATPITSLIYQYFHSVNPIVYPDVYPTAYPWSTDPPGVRYMIHFLLELSTIVPLFCVSPSIDSLFMMYGFQMSGQFREMSFRLKNIKKMADERKAVRECVLQHQSMLKCRDMIEKIYGPIILWMLVSSAIILCAIMFQLSKIRSFSAIRICLLALNLTTRLLMLFIYTWSSSMLTSESEKFRDAIYSSNWPATGQRKFMTSILIMLTQKPLMISACGFVAISIDMFPKTINTAISYFFLLKTMEGKGT
uniref:Odorant receptor n=1 Tax=Meteorus pulchricornis TaxID=51522 RepID=A0A1S5VFK5_9HYME|nr:olfactory receptor 10 [Meteorus pulchricornis]